MFISYVSAAPLIRDRKKFQQDIFYYVRVIFSCLRSKFFLSYKIFFITKFVIHVTKFVTSVRNFVTKTFKEIMKNVRADREKLQGANENFSAEAKGGLP